MQRRTIIAALAQVRLDAIRGDGRGKREAERLLRLYGVDTKALHTPERYAVRFRQNELKRLILRQLRTGPKTSWEMSRAIAAERNADLRLVYDSVTSTMTRLRAQGVVENGGGVWSVSH